MGWDRHKLLWDGTGWDRKICPVDKPAYYAHMELEINLITELTDKARITAYTDFADRCRISYHTKKDGKS